MAKIIITLEDGEEGKVRMETTFDPPLNMSKGTTYAQEIGMEVMVAIASKDEDAHFETEDDDEC